MKKADLIATVSLFPTGQGGRTQPTPDGIFRTLLVIEEKVLSVALVLREVGCVQPGQTVRVPVLFLDWEYAREFCATGKRFLLREVHVIGEGVIEELLN